MISDDFSFYLKGYSLDAILGHYRGWGGRLFADTSASAVLSIGNHAVITLINAVALVGLAWIVACLPASLAPGRLRPHPGVFVLVFVLYWVSNPELGQTSFWIVGSAHYLWTNVLHFSYLLVFLIEWRRDRASPLVILGVMLLALLAGGTNENMGPTTLCITGVLVLIRFRQGARPWRLVAYMAMMAIGVLILVMAPGNAARALNFADWYSGGLGHMLYQHFVRRFPDALFRYWEVFLVVLVLMKAGKPLDAVTKRWIYLFVGAAVFANAILFPAPLIPKRTLNGPFIYLLAAVAFALHARLADGTPALSGRVRMLWAALGVQFIVSYGLIHHAYWGTARQDEVRVALVRQAIAQGKDAVRIPEYYFSPLLKSRDAFDTFFAGGEMARYYGAPHLRITEYPVTGPYDMQHPPVDPQ